VEKMEKLEYGNGFNKSNIATIQEYFPAAIKEVQVNGKTEKQIDFDVLRQEFADHIINQEQERYQMTWPGKKRAQALANTPTDNILRPCKGESKHWEATENVYIEGDNLEALKILQESYLGKIKCIYIDPPYNTGKDFVYRDNFKQDKKDYEKDSGQVDEEGNRLVQNTESNGRFHSDWLSMMYPRLRLARNLLTEDGVIFISIDDNEVHNLRKICDEIFGEGNFIGSLIRKVMEGGKSDSAGIAIEQEYCLCYGKQGSSGIYKKESEHLEHYNKKDKYFDKRGYYYLKPLENGGLGYVPTLDYPITGPNGVDIYPGGLFGDNGYRWVWSRDKFKRAIDLDMIEFTLSQNDKSRYKVYYKIYEKVDTDGNPSVKKLPFPSLYLDGFTNRQAINDLKREFDNTRVFDYPKPLSFLQELCRMASKDNAIVMDFFSGSAGLSQAIMKLNAEDGGRRKYIMVQLPEPTDEKSEAYKAGYKTICEIGKERIRRAGDKIKTETGADIDYGFRVFKIDDSNMINSHQTPDAYAQDQLFQLHSNIKSGRTEEDLLFHTILALGLPLSLKITEKIQHGKRVFRVDENALIACFSDDIPEALIEEIAMEKPLKVVFKDSSFKRDDERLNVEETFKMFSPDTDIKIL